jgi:dethiobiotin synthetase
VLVTGTGTEVGKTWVAVRVVQGLRAAGVAVAVRKPAQSFGPGDDPATTDAAVLGAASGEDPHLVCPPARWYAEAMAPPMAAEALGRPPFMLSDLVTGIAWPAAWVRGGPTVGIVETIGGVRSPLAHDGDTTGLVRLLAPDAVVLVADAGLGTINAVRMSVDALAGAGARAPVVVLNRTRPGDDLHRRNLEWLRDRDGMDVVATPGGEGALVRRIVGRSSPADR